MKSRTYRASWLRNIIAPSFTKKAKGAVSPIELITSALSSAASGAVEKVTKSIFDEVSKITREEVIELHHKVISRPQNVEKSIRHHIQDRMIWCSAVLHRGMNKSISLERLFINTMLLDGLERGNAAQDRSSKYAGDIIKSSSSLVISGDLGSAKTTILKRYALSHWSKVDAQPLLFVRFQDFTNGSTITNEVARILSFEIAPDERQFPDSSVAETRSFRSVLFRAVCAFLDKAEVVLLLDGLDEAPFEDRSDLAKEAEQIASSAQKARIILTSRPPDLKKVLFGFEYYRVEPLSDGMVVDFAQKWFQERGLQDYKKYTIQFMNSLRSKPYSKLSNRPLMIANMCLIFERYRALPAQPVIVYRKIVDLHLEEWDAERGIVRSSRYSQLDPHLKLLFLSSFAYRLALSEGASPSFDRKKMEVIYLEICNRFQLPEHEYREVAADIESTTGIIVQTTGTEYEFAHKSLYEYLVAEYVVRAGIETVPYTAFGRFPNECAISVALSPEPDSWFCNLFVKGGRVSPRAESWFETFISRLALERPTLGYSEQFFRVMVALCFAMRSELAIKFVDVLSMNENFHVRLSAFMSRCDLTTNGKIHSLQFRIEANKYSYNVEYVKFERIFGKFYRRRGFF